MKPLQREPIPRIMAHLERDARGYPIPEGVFRDGNGRPHFTINDEVKRQHHLREDRCPICGGKLTRGRWFVGGPLSAFHARGAYIDPPMHNECAHYALKVCPYLALASYVNRIEDKTLPEGHVAPIMIDPTMIPERPDYFVAVMAVKQEFIADHGSGIIRYVKPRRPYSRIEFWRHGEHVGKDDVHLNDDLLKEAI